MPKVTELVGWGFMVADTQLPDLDENGQPQDDGHGGMKSMAGKLLLLGDPASGDQIKFPLSEVGRQELVRQLTGGVLLPSIARVH